VAKSGSSISAIAERYAGSLYDLAAEAKAVADVERDLGSFEALVNENPDLARLIRSPVFSADEQSKAIAAVLDKVGISGLTGNFLRVVARNRRLFAVPAITAAFRRIAAEARGETSADVVSAHALTPEQEGELKATLKAVAGKDVAIAL
jgi:F-type H+-transporting ATPase subunit delta